MRRALVAGVLLLAACGGLGATSQPPAKVFAAASLSEAFKALGLNASYNFAGSPTLVEQLAGGAQADVLATADQSNMQKAVAAGVVKTTPQVFASNRLAIVVQAGNPKHITSLTDLTRPGLLVVLCAPNVPCGAYATQAFAKAGVSGVKPASLETDVKSVVSKVALGEADAGIVYATDVKAGGPKVTGVDIPDADNVFARYPVAALSTRGQAFVAYLLSEQGQAVLRRYGFGAP